MNQLEQSREIIKIAYHALEDKREDIKVLDIHEVSVIADYFIIASGKNVNQVQAMAEAEEELLKNNFKLIQKKGIIHLGGY